MYVFGTHEYSQRSFFETYLFPAFSIFLELIKYIQCKDGPVENAPSPTYNQKNSHESAKPPSRCDIQDSHKKILHCRNKNKIHIIYVSVSLKSNITVIL